MENMPEFNQNQRDFFRINDSVVLEIRPVDYQEAQHIINNVSPSKFQDHQDDHYLHATLQSTFNHLTDQINQTDRDIARALRILDERITLVSRAIRRQQHHLSDNKMIDVNLSASGLAFMSSTPYKSDDLCEITIELQPSGTIVHAVGKVINCITHDDIPSDACHHVRIEFIHMNDIDRNALVKHALSHQAHTIRNS